MKSVLITGANRGLGLGMVKYLTKHNKAEEIFATCRNASAELIKLSEQNKNLHVLHLDVTNTSSFGEIATQITKVVGDRGLNLLINNAGVTTKFTKIQLVRPEQLQENFTINTIAPILITKALPTNVTNRMATLCTRAGEGMPKYVKERKNGIMFYIKALLPLLKQASIANSGLPAGVQRAAVINMSSILGSIAQNDQGGFYPYRCSKAALNAATKSMSIDLKTNQIVVAAMHPGWVRTDMGGKNAPLDIDTSVAAIFDTIHKLGEKDSGKFLQYDGAELPW